ncbi:MAG: hypothetical protein DRN27_06255, partial [Thermoplasmata archaeon]
SDGDLEVTSSTWRFTTESPDIDLNLSISGGIGITFEIKNNGADSAAVVDWSLSAVAKSSLRRLNKTDDGIIPILAGNGEFTTKMQLFNIGRIEITGTAECDNAETRTITKDAFIYGFFVFIRS